MDIRHVVVLMLENRSFDCMLGMLYPNSDQFDGLIGTESNIWHKPDGTQQNIQVWKDPMLSPTTLTIPDPDPGESFTDIQMQIHGAEVGEPGTAPMGGFVDNYMHQPPTSPPADPYSVMHYFTPDQVPVISRLARAFGVSDRWHASAPCQTWPNRFFVHTGTANGYVNNFPTHFPYNMETVFNRLAAAGKDWRVYFHDIPQSVALSRLWFNVLAHFHHFEEDFARDAAAGNLPAYSFIEPRYFTDTVNGRLPNDSHPPHNVAYGEALIADVYNALRAGPAWKHTLLIVTYDEHSGCFDHVVPPPATPPDDRRPNGYDFSQFGVRVPAVIISPYVRPRSVIRPAGTTPFDHTSIIATLGKLFGFPPLTARDAAAPDLLQSLSATPDNDGPAAILAPAVAPASQQVARAANRPLNSMQQSLTTTAVQLPTAGAQTGAHVQRLSAVRDPVPAPANVGDAAGQVLAHMDAFMDGG